ncbi:MAG: hypothetical protein U0105_10510 [Candidatus Obscuribacterales bacterium]
MSASELQLALTNTAGLSSVASFWVFVGSNAFGKWKDALNKIGVGVLIIGFVALTASIIFRGVEAGRFPLANLYESLLWFAWAIMGAYLFLVGAYGTKQLGWLASLTPQPCLSMEAGCLPGNMKFSHSFPHWSATGVRSMCRR